MRLDSYLSYAGISSRRKSKTIIQDKKISVNDTIVCNPSTHIDIHNDLVMYKNRSISAQNMVFLYHKPRKTLCSHDDPFSRKTIYSDIKISRYIFSIGRLDYNSEGLMILTNNGAMSHYLSSPCNKIPRTYHVTTRQQEKFFYNIHQIMQQISQGIMIQSVQYRPIYIQILKKSHPYITFHLTCFEGKKNEIRIIMKHFKLNVVRLIRIQYGPFFLNSMKPGAIKNVSKLFLKKNNLIFNL